jgi:signal transduction histidine kinase
MTPLRAQPMAEYESRSKASLLSLLQEGQDNAQRLSLHTHLLERRLHAGADSAELLTLVQEVKFAVEELQELFRSATQTVIPTPAEGGSVAGARAAGAPLHTEVVDLGAFLTQYVATVRQQVQRAGVFLLPEIAADLPSVTTDPEVLTQLFAVLFKHLVKIGNKGGLEVRVHWSDDALVIDVYDAGRGISRETYVALRDLVARLQGALKVTQELGKRSRVELSFPPAAVQESRAAVAASAMNKETGQ